MHNATIMENTQQGEPSVLRKWAAIKVLTHVLGGPPYLRREDSHALMRHAADELDRALADTQPRTPAGQHHGPAPEPVVAARKERVLGLDSHPPCASMTAAGLNACHGRPMAACGDALRCRHLLHRDRSLRAA